MRSYLLENKWFFLLGTLAGWALRGYFLKTHALIQGDSLLYGEIAKNWLQSGVFGMGEPESVTPTLIRLPGYPGFLAVLFSVFGIEHYTAVLRAQLVVDLVTCFLIAEAARQMVSERAGKIAFVLAAICPFTANYVATPLTETLSVFASAATLLAAVSALKRSQELRPAWAQWTLCGLAISFAILLRPDGGILLASVLCYLGWLVFFRRSELAGPVRQYLAAGTIVAIIALAPLLPWTIRNWRTFHVFEPLAPRYANNPGEFVPMGFNRWMKTWIVDFVSTSDIYWKVSTDPDGEEANPGDLPARAFDDPAQREQTLALFQSYNQTRMLTPELDQKFADLARERVQRSRLRYYFWLPVLRIADMWLRPRIEMLNLDLRWWNFGDVNESLVSIGLGVLNACYLLAALAGLRKRAGVRFAGLLITFILLRSLMLATLENPEPRYTLECYPAVIILASASLAVMFKKRNSEESTASKS